METDKRLFFSLWPEDALRAELAEILARCRRGDPAKWEALEKLHMTLAFLGDVRLEDLPLLEALGDSLAIPSFEIVLDRIALWRNGILCLTPSGMPEDLKQWVFDLNAKLRDGGFKVEARLYKPHLTLARKAWRKPDIDLNLSWQVKGFCLVESRAGIYHQIKSWSGKE